MKAAKERGLMPSTGLGAGILAAALLVCLTLSVFYVLRDYGPESAIRKYNQAILNGDTAAEDRVSSQSIDTPEAQWLHATVFGYLKAGGRLRLWQLDRHVDRPPSFVVAHVDYVLPYSTHAFNFIVTYENHFWKVNAVATLAFEREIEPHQQY